MKTSFHQSLAIALILGCATIALHAESLVVTYQGRVASGGVNFSGSGQFKAALVTVTNTARSATAIASPPSGGFVTVINVTFGGSGYVSAPNVTITGGGGSGATATASISGGAVTSITVNNPGGGYSSAPTVLIAPPPSALLFATYWSNDGTSNAGSEPASAVITEVAGGLFNLRLGDVSVPNMASLDAGLFQRKDLHLRLWFNDGVNGFAALSPTQPLTAAPYAAAASSAGGVAVPSNQVVNLTINGASVLRLESVFDTLRATDTVNLKGGYPGNVISNGVVGAFIGGGGVGLFPNRVGGDYASVLGGLGNIASGDYSTAMGSGATAQGILSTAMGGGTVASGDSSTSMGSSTVASGSVSTALGDGTLAFGFVSTAMGKSTIAREDYSTAMGHVTTASGISSTAMGDNTVARGRASTAMGVGTAAMGDYSTALGFRAKANHQGALVWADAQNADFATTRENQLLVRATNGVGINTNNPAATLDVNGSFRAGFGTTIFKNLQGGAVQMTYGSSTVRTNYTFTFPKAFGVAPTIIVTARNEPAQPNVNDTFAVSVRNVTTTTCTVNIVRTDNNSGWGQLLFLNWFAWE